MSLNTARHIAISTIMRSLFDEAVAGYSPLFPEFCYEVDSDGASEEYGKTGGVSGMVERLGEINYQRMRAALWTAENKEYVNGMAVDKNDLDDDRHGVYRNVIPKMGVEAAAHPDELMFTLLDAIESTEGWDGQNFVDTDHAWGDSGTQSNELTENVGDPALPSAAECRLTFEKAVNALLNFKNDTGKRFYRPSLKPPMGLQLIVPTLHLQQIFHEALFSAHKDYGVENALVYKPERIVCLPQLTSTTKCYLAKTDTGPERPFLFQRRSPIHRWTKGADDPEAREIKFGCDTRYALVCNAWWNFVQIELT